VGAVAARGPWLSGGRQLIEYSWSVTSIVYSRTNSGKPTSYSYPREGASFRTTYQR
jgi:hypothetical protein